MGACIFCQKSLNEKIEPLDNKEIIDHSSSSLPLKTTESQSPVSTAASISMDDFQPLKLVGKGSFGKVILVKYFNNNKIYAMKILKKEEIIKRKQINHTKTERLLLEKLKHPFIAQLQFAFQDSKNLYLVTEFLQGGELFFHIKRKTCFEESTAKFYMAQLFLAIDYLHTNGYIYRDLKPENILIDKEGFIKLTDFGLSKMILHDDNTNDKNTICGTLDYMAPEIIKGEPYNISVDWYSFGIVLYEMICGKLPFQLKNRKIEECNYNNIEYPKEISPAAKDLISKLLEIDPKKRLGYNSSDEIKKCDFFKEIDFDKIYKKECEPPFRPKFSGELDLKYFDINFTEDNNLCSDDYTEKNDSKGEEKYIEEKDKAKIQDNIAAFEGFTFYKEDEKGKNSDDDDDDLFD